MKLNGIKLLLVLGVLAFFVFLIFLVAIAGSIFPSKQTAVEPVNFEECVAFPGSMLQESYPEVCITNSGGRFVQSVEPSPSPNLYPSTNIKIDVNVGCAGVPGAVCPKGLAE